MACFDGGSFILGGLTLNEQKYIDFGLELVEGCHDTYTSTATGIGPEVFQWQDADTPANASNNPGPPASQAGFYNKAGFWITASSYVLRPEVMESYYYAYRATGDSKYQEWAWDAYVNINKTTHVGSGYSTINDVNAPGGGGFQNFQESFWFAEVLKYSYLIHSEVRLFPSTCSLLMGWLYDIEGANGKCRRRRGKSRPTTRTSSSSTPRRTRSGYLGGRSLLRNKGLAERGHGFGVAWLHGFGYHSLCIY